MIQILDDIDSRLDWIKDGFFGLKINFFFKSSKKSLPVLSSKETLNEKLSSFINVFK